MDSPDDKGSAQEHRGLFLFLMRVTAKEMDYGLGLFGTLLFGLATSVAMGCAWAKEPVHPEEIRKEFIERSTSSNSPRDLALKFKFEIQPDLKLEGRSARQAIDSLAQIGFYCRLVSGPQHPFDKSKTFPHSWGCYLLSSQNGRVNGAVTIDGFMEGWVGDGTSLAVRYDQLSSTAVRNLVSTYNPFYVDTRDSPYSNEEARILDQSFVIASPGQSVADISRAAMLTNTGCRQVVTDESGHDTLTCVAFKPTPRCLIAMVSVDISKGAATSAPFSLWSTDRVAIGKQGPWTCIDSVGGRINR